MKYKNYILNLDEHIKGQKWHISKVNEGVKKLCYLAIEQAKMHDHEKLKHGNVEIYARFQILENKNIPFGSKEYFDELKNLEITETRQKHKITSRHHPEFHNNDFSNMNLVDLIELISDWFTANEYRPTGIELDNMLDWQQKKYNMSDELKKILKNTYLLLKDKSIK